MKRKTALHTHHAPHFYLIFAAFAIGIGVVGTLVVSKVFAQANAMIYSCVQKVGGNMRIVTAGEPCKSNEYSMSWNKEGPQGPSGSSSSSSGLPFTCNSCVLYPVADKLKGKDLSYAQISRSEFQGSDLTGVIFKGANITNTDFSNANLTGADFSNAGNYSGWSLNNVDFSNANLTGANFTNTNLRGVRNMSTANVTDAIWNNTSCPDGTNSNDNGNTCVGHF